jgi:hypothetical protein
VVGIAGTGAEEAAWLGVITSPVDESTAIQLGLTPGIGLVVESIDPGSPSAGVIQRHDILTKLDDQWLVSDRQLAVLSRRHAPGDKAQLTLVRGGRVRTQNMSWGRAAASQPLPPSSPPAVAGPPSLDDWIAQMEQQLGPQFSGQMRHLQDLPSLTDFARTFQDILDSMRVDVAALTKPEPPHTNPRPATGASRSAVQVWDLDHLTITLTESEDGRNLRATDRRGSVMYDGPIDTAEQRRRMPQRIASALERLRAENPTAFSW